MNEKSGSRRGAIRMEHVVIAVLLVAAIILAVLFFGQNVLDMFGVAGQATTGSHSDAYQIESMQENRSRHTTAERASKLFDSQEDKAAGASVNAAEVDIPLSDDDRGRERNVVK